MTDFHTMNTKQQFVNHIMHSDQEEYNFRLSIPLDVSPTHHDQLHSPPSDNSSTPLNQSPPFSHPTPCPSPLTKSPWSSQVPNESYSYTGLMGSLVREEGHVYSLATSGDLLYTGSDSKNIRVWKNQKEFSGFKSNSGLVKAIIIAGERILTGHQDGKIRVWTVSDKDRAVHKRIGTLPTFMNKIKCSFRQANWINHNDAISSLSLSEDKSLLYSASWDKTIKIWRISDLKCLESIIAHDDAVNSVVSGFDGLVFTGSADGSVKVWRREKQGKGTKHFFSQTLLKQECAITALAVDPSVSVLYCGSSDGLVNFWDRDKFLSHGGILRGHKLAVLCLATSGNLVFSGSADTNICAWKKEERDHVCLSVLSGHTGPVKCLAVEEEKGTAKRNGDDDRHFILYSGSLDKSVKIWRISGYAAPMQTMPCPSSQQLYYSDHNAPRAFPSGQSFSTQGNTKEVAE